MFVLCVCVLCMCVCCVCVCVCVCVFVCWRESADNIVADDEVDTLLLLPALGGGCLVASVCGLWAFWSSLSGWAVMGIVVFFVAFATISLTTEVVEATHATLLACFAEVRF